jgi:hypothetical protein
MNPNPGTIFVTIFKLINKAKIIKVIVKGKEIYSINI